MTTDPAVIWNWTPERQRRQRLVDEIAKELDLDNYGDELYQAIANGVLDALLAALEPTTAEMVRLGPAEFAQRSIEQLPRLPKPLRERLVRLISEFKPGGA